MVSVHRSLRTLLNGGEVAAARAYLIAMQSFEASYTCNGFPVYAINLYDDRTAVCPSCKELIGNSQGGNSQGGAISVVPNTVYHLTRQQGCGKPERRTFHVEAYLKFGDLPMISIADYSYLLPFQSMHEIIASGVAKVLAYQLQTQVSQHAALLDSIRKDKVAAQPKALRHFTTWVMRYVMC